MFWRVIAVIGGLTFLVNGCQILGDDQCKSVDLGGTARAMQFTCYRYPSQGDMSQGEAGGLGIVIGLGLIGLAIGPAVVRAAASSGSSYRPPSSGGSRPSGPGPSSVRDHAMRLLRAAAWVLKSVARVGGKGSPEWNRARDALVALGDGLLTPSQAESLLDSASSSNLVVDMFARDDRLVLLKIAIDVAFADGRVSPAEKTALEGLAVRLGFDKQRVQILINLLKGQAGDRTDDLQPAYRTLGVKPGAPVGEIRAAYKKLMRQHHPDLAAPEDRAEATRNTAKINAAYDLVMGQLDSTQPGPTAPPRRQQTAPKPSPPKAKPKPPPPRPSPPPKPPSEAKSPPKAKPPSPPKPEKPPLCGECEHRALSDAPEFCWNCGTKFPATK